MSAIIDTVIIDYQRYGNDFFFTAAANIGSAFVYCQGYNLCDIAAGFINCGNSDIICSKLFRSIACL